MLLHVRYFLFLPADGRRLTVRSCHCDAPTRKRPIANLRYTVRLWTTHSDSAHAHEVEAGPTTPFTLSGDAGCFSRSPRAPPPAPPPAPPLARTRTFALCPRLFHAYRQRSREVTYLKMCGRHGDHNSH